MKAAASQQQQQPKRSGISMLCASCGRRRKGELQMAQLIKIKNKPPGNDC
jgi:hypothetical protein